MGAACAYARASSVLSFAQIRVPVMPLLSLLVTVFIGFLVVGIALPVLPLHVHDGLGQGTFMVGLVTGSQFAAALVTRMWAGNHADTKGAKRAVVVGLLAASAGGWLYLLSLQFVHAPKLSSAILLVGRTVLGGGESFIITGALGWGMALAGAEGTGKVMSWMGTAMYAAFAAGAPIGTALYAGQGFTAVAGATAVVPLMALLLVARLSPVAPRVGVRPSFLKVLSSVWVPGAALAFSSLGFGAITAFVALLFAARGWSPGWPAFTAFAGCFMLARIFLGAKVDRLGGARVALVSVILEAAGLVLVWSANDATLAVAGAALTGLGYSLVYPGLGVEAVRRSPPESRALSMGAYTACLDLALGVGTPALGLVAGRSELADVFLVSAVVVSCSAFIILHVMHRASPA
jgi:MFS family permease